MAIVNTLASSVSRVVSFPLTGLVTAAAFAPSDLFDGDANAFHLSPTDSTIYSDSGDTTIANVNDAINGDVLDVSPNGNNGQGNGVTLREVNGQRFFRVDSDTVSMDLPIPTTLPSVFTIAYTINRGTGNDTLGYTIGSAGENKGLALLQDNATSPPHFGITATVDELSFNNKVFGSPTRKTFFDVIGATGTCVVIQQFSGVTGSAATAWGIGHGSFKLKGDYGDFVYLERSLTAAEAANLVTYMNSKVGITHKGTPYDIDMFDFEGQSNMLGSANDGTLSAPTIDGDLNKSINYAVNTNSLVFPLADPINNNTLGQSIVPAFANAWFAATGRPICSVMNAVGGSALLPYASSAWGETGANTVVARGSIDEAVAALAIHANYELNAIYMVWLQGETEVLNDNGTTITAANYQTAISSKATDTKTWYDANHSGLYQGMWAITLAPRYEDSTERPMQFVDMTLHNNEYNLATIDAAAANSNLGIAFRGTGAYQGLEVAQTGWAFDNVHNGTRASQEIGTLAPLGILGTLSEPSTPTSPFLGSEIFMDDSQSTKNTRTESITTASGTDTLEIAVSGHLFSTGSGQICFEVTFDGVTMAAAGSIEVENSGEVGSGVFYLNETLYGGSLSGVTGDVVVNVQNVGGAAKTVNVINFASVYTQNCHRVERVQGNIDLTSTDTASHTIEPLIGSFLLNVTAANYNSATPTTATVTNLTELYDSGYTITASNKTAQFVVSYGTTAAETAVTPSVVFAASCDEIAPITVAMRDQYAGEA